MKESVSRPGPHGPQSQPQNGQPGAGTLPGALWREGLKRRPSRYKGPGGEEAPVWCLKV